jgi:WD40 repeat protein
MKKFFLFLSIVILFSFAAKGQEIKPDWVTFDITDYTPKFWLDNDKNVVIALVGHSSSLNTAKDFELHFYDLKTKELIKMVDTKTTFVSTDMKLNTEFEEFYYKFQDTIIFINKDNYSIKEKLLLPFNYLLSNSFWYDYSSKQYILFSKRDSGVIFVRFSPTDHTIVKYDTLKIETSFNYRLDYSENGQYFTLRTGDREVMVYETETLKFLRKVNTSNNINSLKVADNGQWLGVFTNYESPETILMYNLNDSTLDFSIENKLNSPPPKIRYSDNGKSFLLSYQNACFVYDIGTKALVRFIDAPNAFVNAEFCINDTKVIDNTSHRVLVLNDINTLQYNYLASYDRFGKIYLLNDVKFSKNGKKFYVSSNDGIVSERLTEDGEITGEFNFMQSYTYIMNRKIEDTLAVYFSSKFLLQFIDVKSKNVLKSFDLRTESKHRGIISPNYKWYAAPIPKKGVMLRNLKSLDSDISYIDSTATITSIHFSSDSKLIALGMQDSIIKIYKTDEFEYNKIPMTFIKNFTGKSGNPIHFIKFVDNNTKLITSNSKIEKFKVWDVMTGDSIANPTAPREHFYGSNYPNISYIEYRNNFNDYVTVDGYGNILFWDINFKFKNCIKIGKSLDLDAATSFDYDVDGNNLLVACQYSTIAKVNLDFITEVESPINSLININISPNPATDYIEITIPELNNGASPIATVQIFNTLGIEVGQSSLIDDKNRIDISHLSSGVYFIKIGDRVEKFVKI